MNGPADPFYLADLHVTDTGSPLAALQAITSPGFLKTLRHGDLQHWFQCLEQLPALQPGQVELQTEIRIGSKHEADGQNQLLETLLRRFVPWRKGPFSLFGVTIDSEWQCGMKWQRLLPHLQPLAGRRVLDVGCGNGYYCLRATGAGAEQVIGLEPYLLYVMQFLAIRRYLPALHCHVLPIRLEDFPGPYHYFDTVLSMGVIYHVRSPIEHLLQLKKCLKPGGEVVIETLTVEGERGYSLTPEDRYARMSNVWFVPSRATLENWMERCGFKQIRVVDTTRTTVQEQRQTSWMPFESLADSLDTTNIERTIEGLPAPMRSIVIGRLPV